METCWNTRDFGDGTSGVGASISKTFATAGAYVVKVVVSDGQATDSQSIVIAVNDQPQTATFRVTKVNLQFNLRKRAATASRFMERSRCPRISTRWAKPSAF